jgi:predicted nucleic acid-binding protein
MRTAVRPSTTYAAWLLALTGADDPLRYPKVCSPAFSDRHESEIFDPPSPMEAAVAFCQRLVDWPRAVMVAPSRRHWDVFVRLCANIHGPLVTDAYLAALAIEHGCELITTDSDFSRFPGLRWRHPFAA